MEEILPNPNINTLPIDLNQGVKIKTEEDSWDHTENYERKLYIKNEINEDTYAKINTDIVKDEPVEAFIFCEKCRETFDSETEFINHQNDMFGCHQQNGCLNTNRRSPISNLNPFDEKPIRNEFPEIKSEPGTEVDLPCSVTVKDEKQPSSDRLVKLKEENDFSEQVLPIIETRNEQSSTTFKEIKPRVPCPLCTKTFGIAKSLKHHIAVVHNNERPFQCQVCLKSFSRNALLKEHENIHTGEKIFECKICSKTFAKNSILKVHEAIHVKRFQCQFCEETFTCKTHLVKHERAHSDKPFQCEICSKRFALKVYLTEHLRSHTGERPYSCSVCFKCFARNSHMRRHEKIHLEEKPYKCEVCSKRFARSSHLREHKRIHSGDKPFKCRACDRRFLQHAHRNLHERSHSGVKEFTCEFCPSSFVQRVHLLKHIKTHYEDKPKQKKSSSDLTDMRNIKEETS